MSVVFLFFLFLNEIGCPDSTSFSSLDRGPKTILALFYNRFDLKTVLSIFQLHGFSFTSQMGRTAMHYAMGLEKVDQIAKILVKGGARKPQDFVSAKIFQP